MLAALSAVHVMIIIIVLILIFGASRLPSIAKNIGKSAKVLKQELNELQDDNSSTRSSTKDDDASNK